MLRALPLLLTLAAAGCAGDSATTSAAPAGDLSPVEGAAAQPPEQDAAEPAAPPSTGESTAMSPAPESLKVTLSMAAEGEGVPLTFAVTTEEDHRFCIYHTPLEASFAGAILEVTGADGTAVSYKGRLKKRGPPQEQDFVAVTADAPRSATFDLSRYYGVESGGVYSVKFVGRAQLNGLPDSNVLQVTVP